MAALWWLTHLPSRAGATNWAARLPISSAMRDSGESKITGPCAVHRHILRTDVFEGLVSLARNLQLLKIARTKSRLWARCHQSKPPMARIEYPCQCLRVLFSLIGALDLLLPTDCSSCSPETGTSGTPGTPSPVLHQTPKTWIAKHPTTTIELTSVLG